MWNHLNLKFSSITEEKQYRYLVSHTCIFHSCPSFELVLFDFLLLSLSDNHRFSREADLDLESVL